MTAQKFSYRESFSSGNTPCILVTKMLLKSLVSYRDFFAAVVPTLRENKKIQMKGGVAYESQAPQPRKGLRTARCKHYNSGESSPSRGDQSGTGQESAGTGHVDLQAQQREELQNKSSVL